MERFFLRAKYLTILIENTYRPLGRIAAFCRSPSHQETCSRIWLFRMANINLLLSLFAPALLSSFSPRYMRFVSLCINKLLLNCIHRRVFSAFNSPSTFSLKATMKFDSPSAERNKLPIWQVLETKVLPGVQNFTAPHFLEIAAGAGVHTQFFAKQLLQAFPNRPFHWYPSDADVSCLNSIVCHVEDDLDLYNSRVVQPPVRLTLDESGICEQETIDLCSGLSFDVILSINMIHISPWAATIGLMKVAGEKLRNRTGLLVLYGPFKVNGTYSDSNRYAAFFFLDVVISRVLNFCLMDHPALLVPRNFDSSLRQRNVQWGVRDLENVVVQAEQNHLTFIELIEMPANNLVLLFRTDHPRSGSSPKDFCKNE
jgi:Protein of unknown function (DUF938)